MAAAGTPHGTTQLRVGRLVKAHGLKGALKVELYTDDPDRRFVPGAAFTLQVPEASPWHGKTVDGARVPLEEPPPGRLPGRRRGPRRRGERSSARSSGSMQDDAAPAEDDAWYDHQLVGLDVVRDGDSVGRVMRVEHLPAQDLLIVKAARRRARCWSRS